VATQQCLHAPEGVGIDKRGLFALVDFVFVAYFAGVKDVGQQARKRSILPPTSANACRPSRGVFSMLCSARMAMAKSGHPIRY
jgi:hypothetical protein